MGGFTGLIGAGGGAGGTSFAGPQAANIQTPTTASQAATAYSGNQSALQQQQALLNAIQAQNGLSNQSNVYNQLQGVATGTGPNPALAQLNQTTGQNVANQAALAAGQRGASSNVGLLARQAAQTGAATQQNAVGQAATLQANQQLNAINAAANVANTQAANQVAATGANTSAQQNEQNTLLNSINAQNQAQVSSQSSINQANAGLANTQLQGQQGLIGGGLNAAGGALGLAKGGKVRKYADGTPNSPVSSDPGSKPFVPSEVNPDYANQPSSLQLNQPKLQQPQASSSAAQSSGPKSSLGMFLNGGGNNSGAQALNQGMANFGAGLSKAFASKPSLTPTSSQTLPASTAMDTMMAAKGGKVPAYLSPGEKYLNPQEAKAVAARKVSPKEVGETIPGKAKVKGDSLKNDTQKKMLDVGGVVVKRTVMNSKDPEKMTKFVAHCLGGLKNG